VKPSSVLAIVGVLLALSTPAAAEQIQIGYSTTAPGPYGPWQTGIGGEFTINDIGGSPADSWLDLSDYSPLTKNQGLTTITSFQTFCVETNEYIYPYNAIYDVTITGSAVKGGVSGGNPDPLSKGTAFLYSQFAQGILSGYNYVAGNRKTTALALQEAIWWLEEEIPTYTAGNIFIGQVAAQFGGLAANGQVNAAAGEFGVYVLNLYLPPTGAFGQDQLYYNAPSIITAVPDGGTTAALLGLALCGIGLARRRVGILYDSPKRLRQEIL
jgi:hypothetical protein